MEHNLGVAPLSVSSLHEQQLLGILLDHYRYGAQWTYIVVWSRPSRDLVWQQGVWPTTSESILALFYTLYRSCQFPLGEGHAGISFFTQQHVWLTGPDVYNTSVLRQKQFLQAAEIQTLLCIPLLDGVVEIGSTQTIPENPILLQMLETSLLQLQSTLTAPVFAEGASTSTTTSSIISTSSLEVSGLRIQHENINWSIALTKTAFDRWKPSEIPQTVPFPNPNSMLKRMLRMLPTIPIAPPVSGSVPSQSRPSRRTPRDRVDKSETHIFIERKRRREHSECISTLRSLLPYKTKDKLSVLRGTIEELNNLRDQVAELQKTSNTNDQPERSEDYIDVTVDGEGNITIRIYQRICQQQDALLQILNHLQSLGFTSTTVHSSTSENSFRLELVAKPVDSRRVQPSQVHEFLTQLFNQQ